MQVAIDNAKRSFDINLNEEISRIKKDMDIEMNGLPSFWFILDRKNKFSKQVLSSEEKRAKKIKEDRKTNKLLRCPMNYLYNLKPSAIYGEESVPMSDLFVKFPLENTRRKSHKVEDLIEKYSNELYEYNTGKDISYHLLEHDFDELLEDIKEIYLPEHCIGLMSWLIDRTFYITPQIQKNKDTCISSLSKNRGILLKILYKINKNSLAECFNKEKKRTPKL